MNLKNFTKHLNKPIKGIIQIGAHVGQEVPELIELTENILLFEPQKNIFNRLLKNIEKYSSIQTENFALGNTDYSKMEMFIADDNEAQSSSLLEPYKHLEQYAKCGFSSKENVKVTSINHYFKNKNFNYNFFVIDTQGYELEVLKGATNYLKDVDFILTEVSNEELYKKCVLIDELDCFLKLYGFKRIEIDWEGKTWGNAIYCKE